MARIAVFYASRYGQTERIAHRIAARLIGHGHEAFAVDLADRNAAESLRGAEAFVLGGPLYLGLFLNALSDFARAHSADLAAHPLAFFSVSLTALDPTPMKQTEVQRLAEAFLLENRLHPRRVSAFAGAVAYREYNFLVRFFMKRMSQQHGGSTDTTRDHDYTDWPAVDAFADQFAADLRPGPGAEAAL